MPAWGNAPGEETEIVQGLKASPICRFWSGLTALQRLATLFLGRCPRLVWNAPSALVSVDARKPIAARPSFLTSGRDLPPLIGKQMRNQCARWKL
jgi:hypothetical protein